MEIYQAEFIKSSAHYKDCPPPDRPEYAFIGRSNVGKSSLINMITGRKSLAKISNTPGKTQLINHFLIDNTWHLVDLPGFGYAASSKKDRAKWDIMVKTYIKNREGLMLVFHLIDVRHPLQKIDESFMKWIGENNIPASFVFTKTDKLSKSQLAKQQAYFTKEFLKYWEELPPMFYTSSGNGLGKEALLQYIDQCNALW